MKELTIEEKAKRFDEALENARYYHDAMEGDVCCVLEECFPQLKESEDERIRKELIFYFQEEIHQCSVQEHADKMREFIAWLEKQGEQKGFIPKSAIETIKEENIDNATKFESKDYNSIDSHFCKPVDKVEPKFHEGDIIKPKDGGHEPWQIIQVDISDKKYRFKDGHIIHFSQENDYELIGHNHVWSEEDEKMLVKCDAAMGYYSPKDKQNVKDWLRSIKDRVLPQKKQEWSEEDERTYKSITYSFANNYPLTVQQQEFVKSLKERYTWKPSDEQMKELRKVFDDYSHGYEDSIIESLYNDLKKLKG